MTKGNGRKEAIAMRQLMVAVMVNRTQDATR